MSTIYVLTRELNAYEQDGEYFVHAWDHKPSKSEIADVAYIDTDSTYGEQLLSHILQGGGRREYEHEWYYLHQV